jgi:hypothetical protein
MNRLEELSKKLMEQTKEMEKVVEEMTAIARASDSHELKYRVLTCLTSPHFGLNGLPTVVKRVVELSEEMKDQGVHQSHCCEDHGCKYGESSCPVVMKVCKQSNKCIDC